MYDSCPRGSWPSGLELQPLTSLTNEQIVAELGWTRKAIKAVLGVTPLTMRPPYGDIEYAPQCVQYMRGVLTL